MGWFEIQGPLCRPLRVPQGVMLGVLGVGRVYLVCIRAITRCWATRLALLSGLNNVPIQLHLAQIQLQISSELSTFQMNRSANLAPIPLYCVACQFQPYFNFAPV